MIDKRIEILRRYYNTQETKIRLKNYVIFYNENDEVIYPSYAIWN